MSPMDAAVAGSGIYFVHSRLCTKAGFEERVEAMQRRVARELLRDQSAQNLQREKTYAPESRTARRHALAAVTRLTFLRISLTSLSSRHCSIFWKASAALSQFLLNPMKKRMSRASSHSSGTLSLLGGHAPLAVRSSFILSIEPRPVKPFSHFCGPQA